MTPELLVALLASFGGLSLLVAVVATLGPTRAPARSSVAGDSGPRRRPTRDASGR